MTVVGRIFYLAIAATFIFFVLEMKLLFVIAFMFALTAAAYEFVKEL